VTRKGEHALAEEAKRKARAAEALRANLQKRKAQARGRTAKETDMSVRTVLDFWFGPKRGELRKAWFDKNPDFDAECRAILGPLVARAAKGELDAWLDTEDGSLALIVLLDQAPRNLHRGTPRAFATDVAALKAARTTIAKGFDRALGGVERVFVYLPFEHAEDLAAQDEACALMRTLPEAAWKAEVVDYADKHRAVIARFGRFPHRNAVLGRDSTEAEKTYLAQPGAGF
jgi:uncharacterized protein (DUF924 family)